MNNECIVLYNMHIGHLNGMMVQITFYYICSVTRSRGLCEMPLSVVFIASVYAVIPSQKSLQMKPK